MSDLGGHCMETLVEAFDGAQDDVPTLFVAWTVKGLGLPFAGHKDNHAGLMNPTQAHALRDSHGHRRGRGMGAAGRARRQPAAGRRGAARAQPHRPRQARPAISAAWPIPAIPAPQGEEQSTQAAFGRILLDLAKAKEPIAERIVTTSPDVTVSTNLGGWVNQRGLFKRRDMADVFAAAKIPSAQKWSATNQGQHIELGIAESNLFLMLAALGLSGDLFGQRLVPMGTLYDPFIARGLDSLNYACYQDARFLLVATPSGITLGPEGGAHQSINPPLIALGQPGLRHYEPAFADELAAMMEEAFRLIDDPAGESTYLRLSTRSLVQPERSGDELEGRRVEGRLLAARAGRRRRGGDRRHGRADARGAGGVGGAERRHPRPRPARHHLARPAPPRLDRGAGQALERRPRAEPHRDACSPGFAPAPASSPCATPRPPRLSWLGGVLGQRVAPLGVEKFGQTGSLADLYAAYRLDGAAITEAVAELLLPA